MTLEQAVEVLNRERHREVDDEWALSHGPVVIAAQGDYYLYPFEAIAIAEKYERRAQQWRFVVTRYGQERIAVQGTGDPGQVQITVPLEYGDTPCLEVAR